MNKKLRYMWLGMSILLISFLQAIELYAQDPLYRFTMNSSLSDTVWSPDGMLLAVSGDWGIKIFDHELVEVSTLSESGYYTLTVSWNPNGLQVASGDTDGKVRIWERPSLASTTFTVTETLDTLYDWVQGVSWSPDGMKIAVLAMEQIRPQILGELGVVQVWRWGGNDWVLHATLPEEIITPLRKLIWSPDSATFLGHGGYGYYYIADADTGNILQSDNGVDVTAVAWFEGSKLAISDEGLFTYIMTTSQSTPVDLLLAAPIYTAMDWSPDGNYLAGGNYGGRIDVWDMSIPDIVMHFDSSAEILELDWHPSANVLVTIGNNGIIELWDVARVGSRCGMCP